MTQSSPILVEHGGAVSVVTVNRPESLNSLNEATLRALRAAVDTLACRADLRCVIVTGAGDKAFVAGADIAAMSTMTTEQGRAFAELGDSTFAAFEALPVPVIAAVHGFALGGGCELALACDFIYATDKAKFGQPEVKLGIVPGFGGTQRLARRVGLGMARELIYTGKIIGAAEALRVGLVNLVCSREELLSKAKETAQLIVANGSLAVAAAKRVMLDGYDVSLDRGVELEAQAFAHCFSTEEQKEGMRAFLEKRPPLFNGK
jgi:enoyl-CoA hydratase